MSPVSTTPDVTTLHVLLIEDNPGDVTLVEDALTAVKAPVVLHTVENAVRAFSYLGRRGAYRDEPRPDAIILDLHLPVIDGQQFLAMMKADSSWASIPVVILSSSATEADRRTAQKHGAIAYQTKPSTWPEYLALARRFVGCLSGGFTG